jgi:hypothetical protein
MLHRKAAQAAEDGSHFPDPPVLKIARRHSAPTNTMRAALRSAVAETAVHQGG